VTTDRRIAAALLRIAADTTDDVKRTLYRLAANELDPTAPTPDPEPAPVVDVNGTPIVVGAWVWDEHDRDGAIAKVVTPCDPDNAVETTDNWHDACDLTVVEPWPAVDQPEWFYEPHATQWVNRDGRVIYDDEARQLATAMTARGAHIIRNGEPVTVGPL
jgi:hypothetical protein